jgi:predicted DNA-binding transcriptional regulator AlpA
MTKIDDAGAALADVPAGQVGEDDLLDLDAVCRFFGGSKPLHPATIYRGLGRRYPLPIRVSPNANRWRRSECEAALQKIIAAPRHALPSPKHRRATA